MPICTICGIKFPNRVRYEGKWRNVSRRKFCLKCHPFGYHHRYENDLRVHGKKTCPKCKEIKQISEFYKKKGNPTAWCKSCFCKDVLNRERRKKIRAINHLGGKCKDCGDMRIPVLVFHHKNPQEKDADWWFMKSRSWERIKKELDKCELLCANCHMMRHHHHQRNSPVA